MTTFYTVVSWLVIPGYWVLIAGVTLRILMKRRAVPSAMAWLLLIIIGLFTAWALGINSFEGTLALGVVLGFAGASFAIALPLDVAGVGRRLRVAHVLPVDVA